MYWAEGLWILRADGAQIDLGQQCIHHEHSEQVVRTAGKKVLRKKKEKTVHLSRTLGAGSKNSWQKSPETHTEPTHVRTQIGTAIDTQIDTQIDTHAWANTQRQKDGERHTNVE